MLYDAGALDDFQDCTEHKKRQRMQIVQGRNRRKLPDRLSSKRPVMICESRHFTYSRGIDCYTTVPVRACVRVCVCVSCRSHILVFGAQSQSPHPLGGEGSDAGSLSKLQSSHPLGAARRHKVDSGAQLLTTRWSGGRERKQKPDGRETSADRAPPPQLQAGPASPHPSDLRTHPPENGRPNTRHLPEAPPPQALGRHGLDP
ncbi:hypothetical protein H920_19811 [Fukomys damarensis]|uniref:Uncharacterized protein n=1 Tax=Fukomys damarensis TaxID=885580 RepID=A0A091CMV3_FUKDA|nr:hypothetical protein H920_19811 [Fukomys damarensis]